MSNLYEQAIADAKKLKEVAEQNATNKIIESIAPQIRRLIEQEISDEIAGDLEAEDDPVEEMIDAEDPDLFQADRALAHQHHPPSGSGGGRRAARRPGHP